MKIHIVNCVATQSQCLVLTLNDVKHAPDTSSFNGSLNDNSIADNKINVSYGTAGEKASYSLDELKNRIANTAIQADQDVCTLKSKTNTAPDIEHNEDPEDYPSVIERINETKYMGVL